MGEKVGQVFLHLSQEVTPLGQNLNSLLEDLRRLNQLKDIQNSTNTTSPKTDTSASLQPPQPVKRVKIR